MISYSLSGEWEIIKDPEGMGPQLGWEKAIPDGCEVKKIRVPGTLRLPEEERDNTYSNVFHKYHGYVYYYQTFPGVENPEKHPYADQMLMNIVAFYGLEVKE